MIEADRSISCGDGSEGTCIGKDYPSEKAIEEGANKSQLWNHLTKVDAAKADILVRSSVHNAERLSCIVYDADSNKILWAEDRVLIARDNDAARILAHFLKVWQSGQK